MDLNTIMEHAIRDGILSGIKAKFAQSYNNPLDVVMNDALGKFTPGLRSLLEDAIYSCINDVEFREQVSTAVRAKLAKTLIARFGGEMEKQVNILKSDPTTRARITLAIEEIVKAQSK